MKCGFCGHIPARWACKNDRSGLWQPACGKCAVRYMKLRMFREIVDVLAIWPRKDLVLP